MIILEIRRSMSEKSGCLSILISRSSLSLLWENKGIYFLPSSLLVSVTHYWFSTLFPVLCSISRPYRNSNRPTAKVSYWIYLVSLFLPFENLPSWQRQIYLQLQVGWHMHLGTILLLQTFHLPLNFSSTWQWHLGAMSSLITAGEFEIILVTGWFSGHF